MPNAPAKTVSGTRTIMSEVMMPNDANFLGKVFGGRILSLVDLCAFTTATRFSGEVCVTASFDRVDFHEPIDVGEVVTMTGFISYVGRSSIEVTIRVEAENPMQGTSRHTNTARVTMVAVRDGRSVEVPRLICETREDKIRFLQGRLRRELRGVYRSERERIEHLFERSSDEHLDELMGTERLSEIMPQA